MRANLQVLRVLLFARILVLPASGFFIGLPPAFSQNTDKPPAAAAEKKPPFQLKVNSNLVMMRVVVRDAEGKPVAGLQKEDFQVFDRGKEQLITQFDVEAASPSPSTSTSAPITGRAGQSPAPAAPDNFLALYFDDLDTPDADMIYVRNAADRFLAANLQPKDRVAIFNSAKMSV